MTFSGALGGLLHRIPALWRQRLLSVVRVADRRGVCIAAVGGCVRDLLLEREPRDWDVVVEGAAAELVRQVADDERARMVEHPRFLTFTLHYTDGTHLDIATARSERYRHPGALPLVEPARLLEDARRRDFTSNALYLKFYPEGGGIWDPTGGQADMQARTLRVLHDQSFVDDPTRLYRAARYAARYGWEVEANTLKWIHQAVDDDRPRVVSLVRLRHEFFHILQEQNPLPALRATWEWGLWKYWNARWSYEESLAERLSSISGPMSLPERLASFLGPDPATAAEALTRFSTPQELKIAVMRLLR